MWKRKEGSSYDIIPTVLWNSFSAGNYGIRFDLQAWDLGEYSAQDEAWKADHDYHPWHPVRYSGVPGGRHIEVYSAGKYLKTGKFPDMEKFPVFLVHYFGFKERQNIIAACPEKFFGPIPYLADECFIIQIIPGAECFRNPIHAGQDKRCFNIVFVHNNRPFWVWCRESFRISAVPCFSGALENFYGGCMFRMYMTWHLLS